jgi:hypothetical protein
VRKDRIRSMQWNMEVMNAADFGFSTKLWRTKLGRTLPNSNILGSDG